MPEQTGAILLTLFVAFLAAKLADELFSRLHLPAVVGEVLVGVVLGPSLLGWVRPDVTLETVATLGIVVLLFGVGLETPVSSLLRVGRTATLVAIGGVVLPLAAGWAVLAAYGYSTAAALFGGTALVATSVAITARVLSEEDLSSTREARIVLAAAVVDDVLGLLVLAVVTGLGRGTLDLLHLGVVAAEAVAFIAFQIFVAPRLVRHSAPLVGHLRISDPTLVVPLVILLGLSALAQVMGLAAIVGAFFAGMAFADTADRWSLRERTLPIAGLLVPFFFVLAGAQVDLRALSSPAALVPGLVLLAVAIVTKVVGCGLGALDQGRQRALAIGTAMVPRGEVGLIVAAIGLSMGVLPAPVYAMVVLVAVGTTIVAPPLLPPLFRYACACELHASRKERVG